MTHFRPVRNRWTLALLVVITIALGLGSRRYSPALPAFVAAYAGDTLWAMMVFFIVGAIFRRQRTVLLAIAALLIAVAVECSQLYHAHWIDSVRSTRLGALVLGSGFLWSDLGCYLAGVSIAAVLDALLWRRSRDTGSGFDRYRGAVP